MDSETRDKIEIAFEEGKQNAEDGKEFKDCPYEEGSPCREPWIQGFVSVKAQDEKISRKYRSAYRLGQRHYDRGINQCPYTDDILKVAYRNAKFWRRERDEANRKREELILRLQNERTRKELEELASPDPVKWNDDGF
jgi:ribosome modulation factor